MARAGTDPAQEPPKVPDHTLTTIAGKPRDRGKQYGHKFKEAIHSFRDKEVYCLAVNPPSRDDLLRYAGDCAKEIKAYCPPSSMSWKESPRERR